MTHIVSVAGCFPPHYYSQDEITEAILQMWSLSERNQERVRRFHQNVGVQGRHLALPLEHYISATGFGERNDAWIETALDLGEAAICAATDRAGLPLEEIAALASTTVTGIAVPTIEARLMNRLPFSHQVKRMPFFGLGCLGGAAGVARLADYLDGHPDEAAVLLSVELCSLTVQHDDVSVPNMISSGLFGDGATAVVLAGSEHRLAQEGQARVLDTRSVLFPETEHVMGWEVQDGGFKVVLSADVTTQAEEGLRPGLSAFLAEHGLLLEDIKHWIVHPGGPKVIDAVERSLGLPQHALDLSRESLAVVGNISSTSVLLILQETLAQQPEPGSYGVLMAMGPAFCAEFVLLQW